MIGFVCLAIVLGLIPGAIAQSKGHSFVAYWLFGIVFLVAALPAALLLSKDAKALDDLAVNSGDFRKCSQCAELIRRDAKICRFCNHVEQAGEPECSCSGTISSA